MIDFASMTKLNMRAVPSPNGSVYFEVSSRVMNGRSAISMRRIHLTFALPSHPGRDRRAGYPCSGRNASPFWPYAMKAWDDALIAYGQNGDAMLHRSGRTR